MSDPVSTYRIQFHKGFTCSDFEGIIPYLEQLGIKTIYASPIFRAVPGSVHGYDVVAPYEINPEIGTLEQLKEISRQLQQKNMCWLQDIVPNHMAFHHDNKWLMDVLEKGKQSEYAAFFDINWNADEQLMTPVLAENPEEVISKRELKVIYENKQLLLCYFDQQFPLREKSKAHILQLHNDPELAVRQINEDKGLLKEILKQQHYQLVHWQETDRHMGYRRFFTINGLISLNIQHDAVFEKVHAFALSLLKENIFQGLRIDHIDGLYDPTDYLRRLRKAAGENAYIVVEKILQRNEALPAYWPVQGTTGYDFTGSVNNLFTEQKNANAFTQFYQHLINDQRKVTEHIYEKKALILHRYMAGELDYLHQLFMEIIAAASPDPATSSPAGVKQVIAEFLIRCPVYRFYANRFPMPGKGTAAIKKITGQIKEALPELEPAADLFLNVLTKPENIQSEKLRQKIIHFYKRCMQFSGPLMAKGVEDTLMYTYAGFISHSEVGDTPGAAGISPETFHNEMLERFKQWPLSMNATATHDTKRGEDLRSRLNVINGCPEEWQQIVTNWMEQNNSLKIKNVPDVNEEYFIYQTLSGAYPLDGIAGADFKERLSGYISKALREAKIHSGWVKPDEEYEKNTIRFTLSLLETQSEFLKSFQPFLQKIKDSGIINSLSQLILKFTCPGVPDTYQGTELWDFSFVDPDNRRAVDYELRMRFLNELKQYKGEHAELLKTLWKERYSGKIKMYLLHVLLQQRNSEALLFEKGNYLPLTVTGKYKDHIFAFARRYLRTWYITVIPLHMAKIVDDKAIETFGWEDTELIFPEGVPSSWENVLSHATGKASKKITINELFDPLPFAVLKMQQPENERGAGILMAISSLASPFGIGDLGPGAKQFVDFLNRSKQKIWQVLPLNPVDASNNYSPYSSASGMAGNSLLISPELLVKENLLDESDLENIQFQETGIADYKKSFELKHALFEKAYSEFKNGDHTVLQSAFHSFCETEAYWLQDFARYQVLHEQYAEPWYQWPEAYRTRDPEAMDALDHQLPKAIEYIKWLQFVFYKQWKNLKKYCNMLGIQIFGDLPFYLSHDSADVWTNPSVFSLDEKSSISGIAGVPPDYFSKTGQLWGMPTYNWEKLKEQKYEWWIGRLRKNLELFDLLRIDHFRALESYWEVPSGEKTAVKGEWKTGPGAHFFDALKQAFGQLPFVAEDLGDNMENVYRFRDAVKLPGMKVLQYAFSENISTAVDIPHNFKPSCIVYTGTHDNNTTLGWYRTETSNDDKNRLEKYTEKKITAQNVSETLIKMAYASVAKIAIIPMQDLLALDEQARMNTPGKAADNWLWRITPAQLTDPELEKKIKQWVIFYNRE